MFLTVQDCYVERHTFGRATLGDFHPASLRGVLKHDLGDWAVHHRRRSEPPYVSSWKSSCGNWEWWVDECDDNPRSEPL